jgi:hypothetical protein
MLRRTPFMGILFGGLLALAVNLFFQDAARPFTLAQEILLLVVSIPPGIGFALFLDPYSRKMKEEYLKMDFYKEDE